MIAAAIDVGTNSTRMLIAETGSGKINTTYRTMEITRIGKNLDKTKMISKASAARTVRVLKEFKQRMEDYRVQSYRAVGTRALRMANNRQWFLDYAASEASIDLEVISGQQEAFLSYRGATADLDITKIIKNYNHDSNDYLVMDIGGGSTELVVGSGSDSIMDISMDMGCVSLKEKFANDYRHMENYVQEFVKENLKSWPDRGFKSAIGLAGTITTLAGIDMELEVYDREKIHHHMLTYDRIEDIYSRLKKMNLSQRKKLKGLHPKRADIIVAGACILVRIMDFLGLDYVVVSESDILDGIIYSIVDF